MLKISERKEEAQGIFWRINDKRNNLVGCKKYKHDASDGGYYG